MDILNQIIASLRKEEIRHFKLLASRSHAGAARKDLRLFDYIKKTGETYEEEAIRTDLYGKKNKNAFYRLRNRLLGELNKSLWLLHFHEDSQTKSLYLYSLAKLYHERELHSPALHFLRRAEREALQQENFEILNLIYGLFIQLSYAEPAINPEQFIRLRQQNRKKLEALDRIDDLVAVLTYRIRISSNHNLKDYKLLDLLQQTVDEYASQEDLAQSPKLRFKIYDAVSKILLQRNQLQALETFLKNTFQQFSEEGLFHRQNHLAKLQMLTYLVNTLYLNGKYRESLDWAEQLRKAMEAYDQLHHDAFLFFYYNALVLNYSIVDEGKAMELMSHLKNDKNLRKKDFNQNFIFINSAGLHYNRGEYKKALRNLIELSIFDAYQNADPALRLRVAIFELIIRFQKKENEILDQRLLQVEKEFEAQLGIEAHAVDHAFLRVMKELNQASFEVQEPAELPRKMEDFLKFSATQDSQEKPIFDYEGFVQKQLALRLETMQA
jgi:hypothetical protein